MMEARELREQLGKVTAEFRSYKQRAFASALRDEKLLHARQRIQELEAELVRLRRQDGPERLREKLREFRRDYEDRFLGYRSRAVAGQEIIRGLRETAQALRDTIGELRAIIRDLRDTLAQRTEQAQRLKDQRDEALARIAELEGGAP